jgi:hypothetical protein
LKCPKKHTKETKTFDELYPPTKQYRAIKRDVQPEDKEFLFEELSKLGRFTGLHWILSAEPSNTPPFNVPIISDLLLSSGYASAENSAEFMQLALLMSEDLIRSVAKQTVGQSSNLLWCQVRKLRLTASNFGAVIQAINRNSFPPSLKKKLTAAYDLATISAVAWGFNHEAEALAAYVSFGAEVTPTGIWLHRSGVLGASPDGIVVSPPALPVNRLHFQDDIAQGLDPEIIEIKCPYAIRNQTCAEAVRIGVDKHSFLESKDGRLHLKESHNYYHQVQGQLFLTDKKCCDLAVWTSKDLQVIRIAKQEHVQFSGTSVLLEW